jgi:hypothetical protein
MRLIGLFFLAVTLIPSSAQQYKKDLLQGTWHLTETYIELEEYYTGRNQCTNEVAKDSLLTLVFKNDTMLKIQSWKYGASDTALYLWEAEDNLIHFWLPNVKKKKQFLKFMYLGALTNFKLNISESLDDHSSFINSYVHLKMTFTKENKEEAYFLQKLFFGDWFISDKRIKDIEDLVNSPLIKLQRRTLYLDTTSSLNPCKEITHQYLNYRLLTISDIGEAAIDYGSDTLVSNPAPCTLRSYETSSVYSRGIPNDYTATVTIFHKSQKIRLTSKYGSSALYKYDRVGDYLILVKQQY